MYSLGLDIGACSVKLAVINKQKQVIYSKYKLHNGKIIETIKSFFEDVTKKINADRITYGSIIGSGHNVLTQNFAIKELNEVYAIVEGAKITCPEANSIIEIGGQSSKYITGIKSNSNLEFSMNSNCSAGTGSFLEEQISRMQLKLEDYSKLVTKAKTIPRIAGRCSVFAKTDITHHQQEGAAVEDILLGLAYAVVQSYQGAVIKRNTRKEPYAFIGGVSKNLGIKMAFKSILKIDDSALIIPNHAESNAAIGAAAIALVNKNEINITKLLACIKQLKLNFKAKQTEILPKLDSFGKNESVNKHKTSLANVENGLYLGIDIGSTSTNTVAMDCDKNVVATEYVKTAGNPIKAIANAFSLIEKKLPVNVEIKGAGITGSGRYMIGKLIGADAVKDEITAQAKASISMHNDVDTIFEIGGQDSKYIQVKNEKVVDFQMNKICAAGTGSFIEEQSKKFNIPISEFGDIALKSQAPISLGERCTVFIETSIASNLAQGAKIEDIASGLCYSIAKNYLNRVVGTKKIGSKILLQGGIAFNQGIINAFRSLTQKQIIVPDYFSVTGAYGAAILAKESMQNNKSKFKGFKIAENNDEIKKVIGYKPKLSNTDLFNKNVQDIVFQGHENIVEQTKKTVGIPRALFTYGMFPMFSKIFENLGFNVVLSSATNEKTIEAGQKYSQDETCYPIKLINGHVAELVEKGVDYIFFPDLHTVDHPDSKTRQNYGCAYMQLAYKIVNQAMDLEKKGIQILAPTIAFNRGKEFMMQSFTKMGKMLGKTPDETMKALQAGMKAAFDFEERLEENAEKVIKTIDPNKKTFVVISKIYGVADPVLNMGIPGRLMDMGYQVIPFYSLPDGDSSIEHPNMFWPFGQHILEPAKLISNQPNMYAIFLTHHCCGPDSVLSHYFSEIMGEKPYLNIEVDEHSSDVGVITRVEAFINSLPENMPAKPFEHYQKSVNYEKLSQTTSLVKLDKSKTIYLPNIYPYSSLFKQLLCKLGYECQQLPTANKKTVNEGRKHTITNEYFSITGLLGDVFSLVNTLPENEKIALFLPQNEGAEIDGQYSRLLKTKLDTKLVDRIEIVSPFLEDFVNVSTELAIEVFNYLVLGDLVLACPSQDREMFLDEILYLIQNQNVTFDFVKKIAENLSLLLLNQKSSKQVLAIGEPFILYNSFMNNHTFTKLEENNVKVNFAPLSEYLWLFWNDALKHKSIEDDTKFDLLKSMMQQINEILQNNKIYSTNTSEFEKIADKTVGLYAGSFGRYRESKTLSSLNNIDGIIAVSSTYENTGIVLDALHKGFKTDKTPKILNLTFDGNKNENDDTKLESFVYYL